MNTLIKGGTIITASDTYQADLLIADDSIALMGADLPVEGAKVVDATGKMITPGGIDVHTHLELPFFGTVSSDDFYTGQKAAAFGGTTTHHTVPNSLALLRLKGRSAGLPVSPIGMRHNML